MANMNIPPLLSHSMYIGMHGLYLLSVFVHEGLSESRHGCDVREVHPHFIPSAQIPSIQHVASIQAHYRTPFVLGMSFPPVLSTACFKARAKALKALSAL